MKTTLLELLWECEGCINKLLEKLDSGIQLECGLTAEMIRACPLIMEKIG